MKETDHLLWQLSGNQYPDKEELTPDKQSSKKQSPNQRTTKEKNPTNWQDKLPYTKSKPYTL